MSTYTPKSNVRILTLALILKNEKILLGMKKRGFGAGRWNGFGGKVNANESIEDAARRELTEEASITADRLMPRGTLTFHFENDPVVLEVHVFSGTDFTGEPAETEEMRPAWFSFEKIPYASMWPDDEFWLPLILQGKNVHGNFWFKDTNALLRYEIQEIA